ncbi:MAG: hypothetical protein GXO90_01125 [FCB group bacterium]|nr:hypothetical protein [FCB group bacterium]
MREYLINRLGIIFLIPVAGMGQTVFSGQMIVNGTWPLKGGSSSVSGVYLPDLRCGKTGDWGFTDMDLSYRLSSTNRGTRNRRWYRAQFRIGGSSWDGRVGLQQLNFGPGRYLRSLQWFDTLDPRDPLQLSNGVWGLRIKKYFQNSALQFWALDNTPVHRGFEWISGADQAPEWGGRYLLSSHGDWGLTFHSRNIHIPSELGNGTSEDGSEWRVALDGVWDVGPGIWFEGVSVSRNLQQNPDWNQERFITIGADYTIPLANGITVSGEYFSTSLGDLTNPIHTTNLAAAEIRSSINISDQISWILFSNWQNGWQVSTISWQRILDSWIIYCGWIIQSGSQSINIPGLGSGGGFTLLLVFNH